MEVLFDIQPEPLAERIVVRVRRDGRYRGCAAAGLIRECHAKPIRNLSGGEVR
jgi:hypothetical protein